MSGAGEADLRSHGHATALPTEGSGLPGWTSGACHSVTVGLLVDFQTNSLVYL
jgi:hypothetical protein